MNSTTQHPTHTWTETTTDTDSQRTYACTECPATAAGCTTCHRILDTTGRVCDECVSRARNDLRDIRDLYRALPDVIAAAAGLHAIRYDRGGTGKKVRSTDTTIIGGSAFVLAGPGNSADRGLNLGRGETTEAIAHLSAAEQNDPPSVLGVLTGWEDAWRVERDEPAATTTSTSAATEYLLANVAWAAQNSGRWDEYRAATRRLLGHLRAVTGTSNAPVKSAVPCPYCSGQIVQQWTDTGLDDAHECTRCGTKWDTGAHFGKAIQAVHQELPETHPDTPVTLDDAKRILKGRIRPKLLDLWAHRDQRDQETHDRALARGEHPSAPRRRLPEIVDHDVRGAARYRLGDLTALCSERPEATA